MMKIIALYQTVFQFWMRFPEKIRYLLVGGYNTVISYALYALFLYLMQESYPQAALLLSNLVASVNSYWTQKIYVFGTKGNYWNEYVRCLFSWGCSYVLNAGLLALFLMKLNPYTAQVLALALVTINSYLMLKYIAFRKGVS